MSSNQKYLESVREFVDSTIRDHATTLEQEYCFDSIVGEGATRIAIKASLTIDNVSTHTLEELMRICQILRCSPLIVGERTRKRPLQDGVIHTRGSIPTLTLETLRRMFEENVFPIILAKKGGMYAIINGDQLKKSREANNLSRGDLADELGVSRRAIYEYERGMICPTIDVALRLEEFLDAQLIESCNPLQMATPSSPFDMEKKNLAEQTRLAKIAVKLFSRLGFSSTLTQETPFDMLTSLQHHVLLSYLKQRLERFDEERLLFLARLAEVLNEEPAIIASDPLTVETIDGIPVIYLKELKSIKDPKELLVLIHTRRGA